MVSQSLLRWQKARLQLKDIEVARVMVGGKSAQQRAAAEQIKQAYVVLLSSHFQAYCRDLHTEATDCLYPVVAPLPAQAIIKIVLTQDRKLDRGNPNPGNIGSDFNRFDFNFWQEVVALDPANVDRQRQLDSLNRWRNAIAHQDFDPAVLGGTTRLDLPVVRRWVLACNRLAISFDRVIFRRLTAIIGHRPW